jgi:hypothetical protein
MIQGQKLSFLPNMIPIHAVLEGSVDLIVANAYKIKYSPEDRQVSSILNG